MAVNQLTPVQRLKTALNAESVQEQFRNALQDSAPLFAASLIDIYGSDRNLQECEPRAVIMEALKAATLRLPINKNLGFAYIVPYKNKGKAEPQMQIGYKGLTNWLCGPGEYRYLNADVVYEGELKSYDKLTGHMDLNGERKGDKVVGYFAYLELLNGFSKQFIGPKNRSSNTPRGLASLTQANILHGRLTSIPSLKTVSSGTSSPSGESCLSRWSRR